MFTMYWRQWGKMLTGLSPGPAVSAGGIEYPVRKRGTSGKGAHLCWTIAVLRVCCYRGPSPHPPFP